MYVSVMRSARRYLRPLSGSKLNRPILHYREKSEKAPIHLKITGWVEYEE
jgi:hypothetical protein